MNIRSQSIRALWARRILLGVWSIAVVAGLALLTEFDTAPGAQGSPPRDWPAGGSAQLDRSRPTLLMFAHPRCPCTRASLDELERKIKTLEPSLASYFPYAAEAATDAGQ